MAFTVARVKAADYPAFRAFLVRVDQAFSRRLFSPGAGKQTAHAPALPPGGQGS